MLRNKNIVLCVTGGIAAYKCPALVRLLIRSGASVRVVMTRAACDFVTPKVLAALSRHDVWVDFFDASHNWHNHVALAEWADLVIVAPLTANTLSKMAIGACDNIVLAVYLSARAPVVVAPAMDLEMYRHVTVRENLKKLVDRGNIIVPAEEGELASGLTGEGRMAEPETILKYVAEKAGKDLPLNGRRVLVNAGPTYEAIDPVRFIGNRSSGRMGVAIAEAFHKAGADVTLVLGPSALAHFSEGIEVVRVEDAEEMHREMLQRFPGTFITVCSAAVADYRPARKKTQKMKKSDREISLVLVRTADILADLGAKKKPGQLLVGFALETENLEENARRKLKSKKLDLIIANQPGENGGGIGAENNTVTFIDRDNKITKFELMSKQAIARDIVTYLIKFTA